MSINLVLAGGVSLGAYAAGAFAPLQEAGLVPDRIAASSVGAVNAAIAAGNPPERRVAKLRRFWQAMSQSGLAPGFLDMLGPLRELHHLASAVGTRLFGQANSFLPDPFRQESGVYDLSPLRRLLAEHVEFDLLNDGPIRSNVMTVDIETGEPVVFDTARDPIGPDHLLASCGFIGDFPAVEIDGRLLGDGGLVANAPVELVLEEAGAEPSACFVVDLFSRAGARPTSPLSAGERRSDLIFASQTWQTIRHYRRLLALRAALGEIAGTLPQDDPARRLRDLGAAASTLLLVLSYQPEPEELLMRGFDFSPTTLSRRWARGESDMEAAIRRFRDLSAAPAGTGLTTVEIR
jgi:NTE family protein